MVGTKAWLLSLFIKGPSKKLPRRGSFNLLSRGVSYQMARPSRLDTPFVFRSVVRDQLLAKIKHFTLLRKGFCLKFQIFNGIVVFQSNQSQALSRPSPLRAGCVGHGQNEKSNSFQHPPRNLVNKLLIKIAALSFFFVILHPKNRENP